MPRDVLMLTSQSPFDPASGAARVDRTVCELLVEAGFTVRAVCTTASEHERPEPHAQVLGALGVSPRVQNAASAGGTRDVWRFERAGVAYTMLDVGQTGPMAWLDAHHDQFMTLVREAVAQRAPDIVFGYGGLRQERERREFVRRAGAASVMYLHNWAYLQSNLWRQLDAVIACSERIAQRYREEAGVETTPMPMPIDDRELEVPDGAPRSFVTFINPSQEKGVVVAARICEDICAKRSDIHFLIVNARKTAETLVRIGLAGGFDLRRHGQIVMSGGVPTPGPIFAATKILIVPSVWEEPGARIVAEAMYTGTPAIISDRGGMRGTARGGAIVLSLPDHVTPATRVPITSDEAAPWVEAIEHLWDDPEVLQSYRWRAAAAGEVYRRENLRREFAAFFENVRKIKP